MATAGVRVFGAGAVLHGEYPHAVAVGRSAEPVGDADSDPFLAADYRAYSPLGRRFDNRCGGKTGKVLYALPFQYLSDRIRLFSPACLLPRVRLIDA